MIKSKVTRLKILILFPLCGIFLIFPLTLHVFAMYDGSPNWRAPKKAICMGIPDFPGGMQILTYKDQVFGKSFDAYIFYEMAGAFGIYYFQMKLQDPHNPNGLHGTATYIDSINWNPIEFKVTCVVKEWHKAGP